MVKLYIGNLLYEVTDDDLRNHFSSYGNIIDAAVVRYQKSQRSKGYGFVTFETEDQAQAAIAALHGTDLRGRKLVVSKAKSPVNSTPLASGGKPEEKENASPIRSFFGTIFQKNGKRSQEES